MTRTRDAPWTVDCVQGLAGAASDLLVALFIKNPSGAAAEGKVLVTRVIGLLERYADKTSAPWLEVLGG